MFNFIKSLFIVSFLLILNTELALIKSAFCSDPTEQAAKRHKSGSIVAPQEQASGADVPQAARLSSASGSPTLQRVLSHHYAVATNGYGL